MSCCLQSSFFVTVTRQPPGSRFGQIVWLAPRYRSTKKTRCSYKEQSLRDVGHPHWPLTSQQRQAVSTWCKWTENSRLSFSPVRKPWTLTANSADALVPKPETWWINRTHFKVPEATVKAENIRKENAKHALCVHHEKGKKPSFLPALERALCFPLCERSDAKRQTVFSHALCNLNVAPISQGTGGKGNQRYLI